MRELANLLYHAGNIRGAYRWWSESLDMLLNTKGMILNTNGKNYFAILCSWLFQSQLSHRIGVVRDLGEKALTLLFLMTLSVSL